MKFSPARFAFSALASVALMATSANAAPILDFSQQTPANSVISTNAGNNSTLSTAGTQVGVTALAGVGTNPVPTFIENFSFTSSQAPVGSDGNITQGGFNGTFSYIAPNGVVQVAGNVIGGILSTVTTPGGGGTTANFNASNVVFTTIAPAILQQAFGFAPPLNLLQGNFSLTLNNLNPLTTTSLNFTARAAGIITAQVVPEPASVVMMSMALVAGIGGMGLRRLKASRA